MKKRDSFRSKWGFILACIGSAVGMGNIWMFPTRVSLYGGGSFIIPYFIFVVLIGSTGVIGEMAFGRATRSGPVNAFGAACETKKKKKIGEAVGMIPVLGSLAMAIGYTVVLGWILKYCIGTFTGTTATPTTAFPLLPATSASAYRLTKLPPAIIIPSSVVTNLTGSLSEVATTVPFGIATS